MSNLSLRHLVRKLRIKLSSRHLMRSSMSPKLAWSCYVIAPGAPGLEWGLTSPTLPQEPDKPGASPGPLQEIVNDITLNIFSILAMSDKVKRVFSEAHQTVS